MKPIFKKRIHLLLILIFIIPFLSGCDEVMDNTSYHNNYSQPPAIENIVKQEQPIKNVIPEVNTETNNNLSNDNHYTNVDGNKVHSPAYSDTIPVGASAKCRDGSYSFSQHRSGTCSHHGGVAKWY
ncbi:MAG: DUF3761 domain-containing protein [Patescibacteria group bacterium]|nr:DUF3761 domain-containing protein [Patescibacteria group bacterium]MDD4695092.1 DUF3761 domain-containing protein [Patescibacteria group bacterium]